MPSPEGHCHWGRRPPYCSVPSLGSPTPTPTPAFPPAAGPRHVDFALGSQSLELSPPGLPSLDSQPLSRPSPLAPNPSPLVAPVPAEIGNLESRPTAGSPDHPSHFHSPADGTAPPEPRDPPLPHPRDSVSWAMLCVSVMERPSWPPHTHTLSAPPGPCRCGLCAEHFFGSLHGQSLVSPL